VFRHPLLRTVALVNTVQSLGTGVVGVVILLFAYQSLHLSPGLVGAAMAIGSVGYILGTMVVSSVTRKLGVGPTLGFSSLVGASSYLLIPLGLFGFPAVVLAVWRLLYGMHIPTFDINQVSLRQTITPDRLQGRMNATIRTTSYGALGVGPLIGGFLGTQVGLVPTILLGGSIYVVATVLLLTKSMITLKEFPAPVPF
jgi:MFS family permease